MLPIQDKEFGAWFLYFLSPSNPLFFFFKLAFPSLLLSAPLFPSELLIFPLSTLFIPQSFFSPMLIFHALPQFPLLPHLSISCLLLLGWAAWKQLINSPVLFPLLLLKKVLWDGINQHQVWHLPEDAHRTCAIRWRDAQWPFVHSPPPRL